MKKHLLFTAAAGFFLLAAACASQKNDVGSDTALDRDAAPDPGDTGDDGCSPGLTDCGGACVDLRTDRSNCGACGHECDSIEVCSDGACGIECPVGWENCSGLCVDTDSDPGNCGACANNCADDEVCNEGECLAECETGYTNCFGSCVDLQTSSYHCGACGNGCEVDEDCIGGECRGGCGDDNCSGAEGENQCTCPEDCGPCTGCCLSGACYPGGTTDACGSGGESCDTCSAGETCSAGDCICEAVPCAAECCVTEQRCVAGRCCDEAWVTAIAGVYLTGITMDADGTIYASGQTNDSTSVFVAALDACGTVLSSAAYAPPGSMEAHGARVAVGSQVLTAGHVYASDSVYNGAYCAFSKHPVSAVGCNTIDLSEGNDAFWGIAASEGGFFWLHGFIDAPDSTRPTLIKSTGYGSACGWDPFADTGGGEGRDIAAYGAGVYATGGHQGQAYVVRYGYGSCSTGGPCPHCDPDASVKFSVEGATSVMGFDVAVDGETAYVGGFKALEDTGAYAPLLAKVNMSTASLISTAGEPDVTSDLDLYSGLAFDGSGLFGVGAYGYQGIADLAGTQGFITKIRATDLSKEWIETPAAINAVYDVTTDGDGGVLCAGAGPASGYVVRCTSSGSCPF